MPITFFWIFAGLMLFGVPIVFALAAAPLAGFLLAEKVFFLKMVPQRMFGGMSQFHIIAIPMFILAGEAMNTGGITQALVRFAKVLVGHVRAGLAQTNILASILFSGISGSAVADSSALGSILIPAMKKEGYPTAFSAAVTAASSVIGPIVPPSIIMVVYAYVMQVSVGALFLAGIVPGLLLGLGLMLMTAIIGHRRDYPKSDKRASLTEMRNAFKSAFLPLMTPVVILGGIVSGIVTPTEAAGVAVFYSLFIGLFVLRTISLSDLPRIFYRTGLMSSGIILMIGAASIFAWAVTISGVPQTVGAAMVRLTDDPLLLLLMVSGVLLIVGMFLDAIPAVLVLGPIFAPPVIAAGVDPLHLAVVMCVNLTIGLATPPVGMLLFVTSTVSGEKIEAITKEIWPYLLVHLGVLLAITLFPSIVLTIPHFFGFR
ncbi:MAG: TRAP transporter large permease [Paracoccaceae bacterium]